MSTIFEELYYGELRQNENKPNDEEYLKCRAEYDEAYEALKGTLDENQKKLLDEVFFCSASVTKVLEYLSYKEGFRAALQLAFEMLK